MVRRTGAKKKPENCQKRCATAYASPLFHPNQCAACSARGGRGRTDCMRLTILPRSALLSSSFSRRGSSSSLPAFLPLTSRRLRALREETVRGVDKAGRKRYPTCNEVRRRAVLSFARSIVVRTTPCSHLLAQKRDWPKMRRLRKNTPCSWRRGKDPKGPVKCVAKRRAEHILQTRVRRAVNRENTRMAHRLQHSRFLGV